MLSKVGQNGMGFSGSPASRIGALALAAISPAFVTFLLFKVSQATIPYPFLFSLLKLLYRCLESPCPRRSTTSDTATGRTIKSGRRTPLFSSRSCRAAQLFLRLENLNILAAHCLCYYLHRSQRIREIRVKRRLHFKMVVDNNYLTSTSSNITAFPKSTYLADRKAKASSVRQLRRGNVGSIYTSCIHLVAPWNYSGL